MLFSIIYADKKIIIIVYIRELEDIFLIPTKDYFWKVQDITYRDLHQLKNITWRQRKIFFFEKSRQVVKGEKIEHPFDHKLL